MLAHDDAGDARIRTASSRAAVDLRRPGFSASLTLLAFENGLLHPDHRLHRLAHLGGQDVQRWLRWLDAVEGGRLNASAPRITARRSAMNFEYSRCVRSASMTSSQRR